MYVNVKYHLKRIFSDGFLAVFLILRYLLISSVFKFCHVLIYLSDDYFPVLLLVLWLIRRFSLHPNGWRLLWRLDLKVSHFLEPRSIVSCIGNVKETSSACSFVRTSHRRMVTGSTIKVKYATYNDVITAYVTNIWRTFFLTVYGTSAPLALLCSFWGLEIRLSISGMCSPKAAEGRMGADYENDISADRNWTL